jgi:hypothetical protein
MGCWEKYHIELFKDAKDYSDLVYITLDALEKMPQPIVQVCGPISSGGRGSIEKNLKIFKKTIRKLSEKHSVFDQTILEQPMRRIMKTYHCSHEENNRILLESFYGPILKSGLIQKTFFIDRWESSQGATWEHETSKKIGLERFYLPENFLKR